MLFDMLFLRVVDYMWMVAAVYRASPLRHDHVLGRYWNDGKRRLLVGLIKEFDEDGG